jgi:DNA (cytosine-5)-methyltransferase 1
VQKFPQRRSALLNTLDLFAGIGGFAFGLERTGGFKTAAFCEIDEKAQMVLKKHWPNIPVFGDVTTLTKEKLDEQGITIDIITGGFPCQDISFAGRGAGLEGKRSGLWFEFARLIEEIQPKYAIIENVSALRFRGLDQVLWSLAEIGYDAEWHCIPAKAIGAPHQRDRIWIIAYPQGRKLDNTECVGCYEKRDDHEEYDGDKFSPTSQHSSSMADTSSSRGSSWLSTERHGQEGDSKITYHLGYRLSRWEGGHIWSTEPDVGRVANGVPRRVDRLKQLGNAVVPQIPQLIGEAILEVERNL